MEFVAMKRRNGSRAMMCATEFTGKKKKVKEHGRGVDVCTDVVSLFFDQFHRRMIATSIATRWWRR
jgi:hypothetical protein